MCVCVCVCVSDGESEQGIEREIGGTEKCMERQKVILIDFESLIRLATVYGIDSHQSERERERERGEGGSEGGRERERE